MTLAGLVSLRLLERIIVVEITFDLDTSNIGKLPGKWEKAKKQGLFYNAQDMTRLLIENTSNGNPRVIHGRLKSWFIESIDDTEAHIKTPAEYAYYVNYGTRPHFIYPVNKKMLYWEGADHPVPYVVHPGTTPTLFIENAIDDVEGRLAGYFLKALEEVMG